MGSSANAYVSVVDNQIVASIASHLEFEHEVLPSEFAVFADPVKNAFEDDHLIDVVLENLILSGTPSDLRHVSFESAEIGIERLNVSSMVLNHQFSVLLLIVLQVLIPPIKLANYFISF